MKTSPLAGQTPDEPTAALVAAARHQDRRAIEQLLLRQLPLLEAFVRLRMGAALRSVATAPDMVQSVCREVLQDLGDFEYRGEAAFRHWLYVRAENKLREKHRYYHADKRNIALARELPENSTCAAAYATFCTPSRDVELRESLRRVEAAFDQLPADYREAVTLHKLCGLSHREIAAQMGKSEGAVRNLVYRGISRLALLVEGGDTTPD